MKRAIPTWGRVTAAPHEHLLVIRKGRVVRSQQGGSCFTWPSDVVALVDTSVHRLQFTADQVTREKTGVRVTGLAVFRVVEPALAYRMLNLEQPSEYHEILREMFTGATRRLVANLSLEDCLTRRKDALAAELMAEVAPVVQGGGQTQDGTDRGWGVVIDTIEVQDVRILSEEVFSRLQAPYREGLALEAVRAEAEVARERARIEADQARTVEQHRRELMALEEARLEAERTRARQQLAHDQELARLGQQSEAALEEASLAARLAAEHRQATARAERERLLAEAEVETTRMRAEALREQGAATAEVRRLERAALDAVSEARLREIALTETLPRMAEAFAESVEQATVISGDASFLGMGLAQTVASLKAVGFDLGRLMGEAR